MTRIEFTECLRKLLNFCSKNGIQVQIDYVKRSPEEQRRLIAQGRSWTMTSDHLKGKAVDLQVIKDGKFLINGEEYYRMGQFWESLNPKCYWGAGKNKDGTVRDVYHFGVK